MKEIKETPLFVTSCFTTYVDSINNFAIIDNIAELQKSSQQRQRSNVGGFQSTHFTSSNYDNPETANLFENCIKPIAKQIAAAWKLPCSMENAGYWYNVNYKYSSNREHTHPNSFLSGCYYLKVPQNSGNIVFLRAQSEYDRMGFITQTLAEQNNNVDNSRLNTEHWFVPHEGMLVLFPGHLSHYVQQNLTTDTDDRRISLAFNFNS